MIACWRIQPLSSLLALCGVYSGGLASASPVGRLGLAIPLGRDKRIAGRALFLFSLRSALSF